MTDDKKDNKVDLGLLEEDDEFEEFPAEEWNQDKEEKKEVVGWEDNWDEETVEDDFSDQLRKMRERQAVHSPPSVKMDSAPNLELVVQAITSLYNNPDSKQKEEASKLLQSLQKSVYAWKISDELLQLIVTQLCLAVSDLILLMPDWKNTVQDLLTRLGQTQVATLLESLVFRPEEVDSRYLRLGANRRQQIKDDFTAAFPAVTQFLQCCVANIPVSLINQVGVIKCYSCWLNLGVINVSQLHLEEVLHFLKSAPIENEEARNVIQKPLDDLLSSLKYIQNGKHFSLLPTEIKMNIMSYLCNSNAFTAASVCEEWKEMLGSRFKEVDTVIIGKHNGDHKKYGCDESNDCANGSKHLSPKVMLEAAALHKLNVHLKILDDFTVSNVDPKVVTKGFLSVKKFTLSARYPLLFRQLEDLFTGLEKGDKVMEYVELGYLDRLSHLDQDSFVHCLVDKIKSLYIFLKFEMVKKLLNTIITPRPVKLKSLFLAININFSILINPEDLKKLINKMTKIRLAGWFTPEQKEAAKSLPDVKVEAYLITKGF